MGLQELTYLLQHQAHALHTVRWDRSVQTERFVLGFAEQIDPGVDLVVMDGVVQSVHIVLGSEDHTDSEVVGLVETDGVVQTVRFALGWGEHIAGFPNNFEVVVDLDLVAKDLVVAAVVRDGDTVAVDEGILEPPLGQSDHNKLENHHSSEVDSEPETDQMVAVLHIVRVSTNLVPVSLDHLQIMTFPGALPMILLFPITLLKEKCNL